MVRELRRAVFLWRYDKDREGPESESILLQLQRLFARLDGASSQAVGTLELTKSFGWERSDGYRQQDAQELMRVLFEALSISLAGSPFASLVSDLFEGRMADTVTCCACGNVRERTDTFEDLPLLVRRVSESGHVPFRTVPRALASFVGGERLEGANQYHCEQCDAKRDAVKRLRITAMPRYLTLHLKRFDYDRRTEMRVKLHEPMEIRETLVLDELVDAHDDSSSQVEIISSTPAADEDATGDPVGAARGGAGAGAAAAASAAAGAGAGRGGEAGSAAPAVAAPPTGLGVGEAIDSAGEAIDLTPDDCTWPTPVIGAASHAKEPSAPGAAATAAEPAAGTSDGSWTCPTCTLINDARNDTCEACLAIGPWLCVGCSKVNAAGNGTCVDCLRARDAHVDGVASERLETLAAVALNVGNSGEVQEGWIMTGDAAPRHRYEASQVNTEAEKERLFDAEMSRKVPCAACTAGERGRLGFRYRLNSVLVHNGNAAAGHYYALIRPPGQDAWFRFDDTAVTKLTADDMLAYFGRDFGTEHVYRRADEDEVTEPVRVPAEAAPADIAGDEGAPASPSNVTADVEAAAGGGAATSGAPQPDATRPIVESGAYMLMYTRECDECGALPVVSSDVLPADVRDYVRKKNASVVASGASGAAAKESQSFSSEIIQGYIPNFFADTDSAWENYGRGGTGPTSSNRITALPQNLWPPDSNDVVGDGDPLPIPPSQAAHYGLDSVTAAAGTPPGNFVTVTVRTVDGQPIALSVPAEALCSVVYHHCMFASGIPWRSTTLTTNVSGFESVPLELDARVDDVLSDGHRIQATHMDFPTCGPGAPEGLANFPREVMVMVSVPVNRDDRVLQNHVTQSFSSPLAPPHVFVPAVYVQPKRDETGAELRKRVAIALIELLGTHPSPPRWQRRLIKRHSAPEEPQDAEPHTAKRARVARDDAEEGAIRRLSLSFRLSTGVPVRIDGAVAPEVMEGAAIAEEMPWKTFSGRRTVNEVCVTFTHGGVITASRLVVHLVGVVRGDEPPQPLHRCLVMFRSASLRDLRERVAKASGIDAVGLQLLQVQAEDVAVENLEDLGTAVTDLRGEPGATLATVIGHSSTVFLVAWDGKGGEWKPPELLSAADELHAMFPDDGDAPPLSSEDLARSLIRPASMGHPSVAWGDDARPGAAPSAADQGAAPGLEGGVLASVAASAPLLPGDDEDDELRLALEMSVRECESPPRSGSPKRGADANDATPARASLGESGIRIRKRRR